MDIHITGELKQTKTKQLRKQSIELIKEEEEKKTLKGFSKYVKNLINVLTFYVNFTSLLRKCVITLFYKISSLIINFKNPLVSLDGYVEMSNYWNSLFFNHQPKKFHILSKYCAVFTVS